ncbi:hypothetical protein [Enorma massiliensis]|uniref:hypothetical protein n=1 Tax=Enorma massiliensis TaxID=1472761 RepID=UPI003A8D59A7
MGNISVETAQEVARAMGAGEAFLEAPADSVVGLAIGCVSELRDVCEFADPGLASECRRALGALWALAARTETSDARMLPAMGAVRVRSASRAVEALGRIMREPTLGKFRMAGDE